MFGTHTHNVIVFIVNNILSKLINKSIIIIQEIHKKACIGQAPYNIIINNNL